MVARRAAAAIDVRDVARSYGPVTALAGLSLQVGAGEIHALLGRNGAGKTTLIRVLSGLVRPTRGTCTIGGVDVADAPQAIRRLVGLVPSGDRSFYLRLSALENLVFFGRLYGLRKREAADRALVLLEDVGLGDAARRPLSTYSHGMQKRVSVARALLTDPPVLLVDEATHDLDPEGAVQVRGLMRAAAERGAAVLWATQRVEEIRGFADRVTVLELGTARFAGTVGELLALAGARRFVITVAANGAGAPVPLQALQESLQDLARIAPAGAEQGVYLLALDDGATLGQALAMLRQADAEVLSCRNERPEVEEAFLALVGRDAA